MWRHGWFWSNSKVLVLRHALPARCEQQPTAVGDLRVQEAVWSKARQSHRGGLGQLAQRVTTETALSVARSAALLHGVPCCPHELQPALQPHRSLCPEPRRPLGVLSASQEGAVGHLSTRYTHTFYSIYVPAIAFIHVLFSSVSPCFATRGQQRPVLATAGTHVTWCCCDSDAFSSFCQVASVKIRFIWTGSSGCFATAGTSTSRCWRL